MIVLSMLLVIVGFVTLLLGVLNVDLAGVEPLTFVYASIAACLAAGVFLVLGVLRSRPSRKPAVTPGAGEAASWSGASPPRAEQRRHDERPDHDERARQEWQPQPDEPPASEGDADAAAAGMTSVRRVSAAEIEARLGAVPGVGPARQRALLEHFGSRSALARATVAEIAEVRGVSEGLARRIHQSLHT